MRLGNSARTCPSQSYFWSRYRFQPGSVNRDGYWVSDNYNHAPVKVRIHCQIGWAPDRNKELSLSSGHINNPRKSGKPGQGPMGLSLQLPLRSQGKVRWDFTSNYLHSERVWWDFCLYIYIYIQMVSPRNVCIRRSIHTPNSCLFISYHSPFA